MAVVVGGLGGAVGVVLIVTAKEVLGTTKEVLGTTEEVLGTTKEVLGLFLGFLRIS